MELLDFLTCLRLRVQRPPLARPPPVEASAPPMLVAPFSNKTLIIRSAFKPSKKGSLSIAIYRGEKAPYKLSDCFFEVMRSSLLSKRRLGLESKKQGSESKRETGVLHKGR